MSEQYNIFLLVALCWHSVEMFVQFCCLPLHASVNLSFIFSLSSFMWSSLWVEIPHYRKHLLVPAVSSSDFSRPVTTLTLLTIQLHVTSSTEGWKLGVSQCRCLWPTAKVDLLNDTAWNKFIVIFMKPGCFIIWGFPALQSSCDLVKCRNNNSLQVYSPLKQTKASSFFFSLHLAPSALDSIFT